MSLKSKINVHKHNEHARDGVGSSTHCIKLQKYWKVHLKRYWFIYCYRLYTVQCEDRYLVKILLQPRKESLGNGTDVTLMLWGTGWTQWRKSLTHIWVETEASWVSHKMGQMDNIPSPQQRHRRRSSIYNLLVLLLWIICISLSPFLLFFCYVKTKFKRKKTKHCLSRTNFGHRWIHHFALLHIKIPSLMQNSTSVLHQRF